VAGQALTDRRGLNVGDRGQPVQIEPGGGQRRGRERLGRQFNRRMGGPFGDSFEPFAGFYISKIRCKPVSAAAN
jgi:hypothetical protein